MTKRTRTPWVGVFILIAGASLCAPQIAGALPSRASAKAAAPAKADTPKNPNKPPNTDVDTCKATFTVSGNVATVHPGLHCPENYLLVSYSAQSGTVFTQSWPQTFFQASTNGSTVMIPSDVLTCMWQVDYIEQNADDGAPIPVINRTIRYGERIVAGMLGGAPCPPPTTTTRGTTKPTVLGTSIAPTTTDAEVLGTTQTLPRTGAPHVGFEALMGLGLMAFGGSILVVDRRRRRLA